MDDLLDDWRIDRSDTLARAIDELTAEHVAGVAPPEPVHDRAFHRMWLEVVKDPSRRGWAAAKLHDRLPGAQGRHRLDALAKRIEALAACGQDPRTSHAVARAIAADPTVLLYRRVLDAAIVALGDSGDARSDRLLAEISGVAPEGIDFLLRGVGIYRASAKPRPALGLHEYTDPVGSTPLIEELWQQLVMTPHDDATRAVLGDALVANGDPRGELFALQLAAGGDPQRRARISALLARFGDAWIGPLKAIASSVVFRRGAVASAALRASPWQPWDELASSRVLATIELVEAHGTHDNEDHLRLIASPAMRSLWSVEVRTVEVAATLSSLSAPVRRVGLIVPTDTAHARDVLRHAIVPACAARSSIVEVVGGIGIYDALATTGWLDHLTALTIAGRFHEGLALWRQIPHELKLTVSSFGGLELVPGPEHAIALRRDGASTIARVFGSWLLQRLDPLLTSIPSLARVEIAGGEQLASRIRSELRGVDVVTIEPPDPGQLHTVLT
jgi:hypothetical protein